MKNKKIKIMLENNFTISQLIEFLKNKGIGIITNESSVLGLPKNKYIERYILEYDNSFWLIYSIIDNFEDKCYYTDVEEYDDKIDVENAFINLARFK
ncbi:hypothetical protein [Flavobacterium okayamense]|uniref:Uncharacterized protein n=1 Tax=Flavobacterium okayamense TaxID=2830782 RepID=A0ABM7SAF4_9FLAO|nr:hypothetical protein [Flavobacterium okayamense]BCY29693.1 hypothetical protein KK2020170_25610 [Flavobacterium okayamense]